MKDTVVLVESQSKSGAAIQGSGVVFNQGFDQALFLKDQTLEPASSWIATNAHVVRDATQVTVRQLDRRHAAKIEYVDEEFDLAILLVEGAEFPKATVATGAKLSIGEKVYAIGAPFGLEQTITEGILSGIRSRSGTVLLQNSAAISSGNSGGGLFDTQARLVGITTFRLKGGENLSFALDAACVAEVQEALYAADILRIAADGAFPSTDLRLVGSHRLTKWLLDARTPGGLKYWMEVLRLDHEFFQSKQRSVKDFELRFEAQRQIVARFLAAQAAAQSEPSTSSSGEPMQLVCAIADERGGNRRDFSVLLDVSRSTANGSPANVSDAEVHWRHGENNRFFAVLNRYTGSLRIGSDKFPTLCTGTCSRVGQRRF